MSHTPGPWTATQWHSRHIIKTLSGKWRTIADVKFREGSDQAGLANAALIAAAPDLLAALKAMTPDITPPKDAPCHYGLVEQDRCGHCQRIIAAQKAIEKAEKP